MKRVSLLRYKLQPFINESIVGKQKHNGIDELKCGSWDIRTRHGNSNFYAGGGRPTTTRTIQSITCNNLARPPRTRGFGGLEKPPVLLAIFFSGEASLGSYYT